MSRKKNGSQQPNNGSADEMPRDSSGQPIHRRSNPIYESENCYWLKCGGDKADKPISNFIMRPVNAIHSDNSYLLDIEFTLANGTAFVKQLNSSAFASVQKFKAELKKISGLDMTFDGTESDLSHIQNFMNNKYRSYNRCRGVSYVGLHKVDGEWAYVGTDGAIDRKGNPITSIVSILEDNEALKSTITDAELIKGNELKDLSPDLFRFNTYERTIPIIGWVCVCFLKERLRKRRIKLSHLVMAGGAGSGKSETLEKIIQPIFSLVGSGIGCKGLTNFSTLKSTSSTNLLPIIYEEYKPHRLNVAELNTISGLMRSTYDYQTSQRGRADQSVVNYMRRSPVILVGESSFDETAIKERIIDVQFAKSDRTEEHTKSYKTLGRKEKALNSLGKGLLLLAMNMPDEDLDRLINQSKAFEALDFESRVILGISNVKLGILLLKTLYEEFHLDFERLTGITDKLVYDSLVACTLNAMDGSGKVNSAVDLIIQTFDTMALKGRLRKDYDYIINQEAGELCLRINLIYDEFTKYVREFNITDVEVLASRQFTKQLRKESYYLNYTNRTFKKRDDDKATEITKCYILDLKKLNQICSLEAFSYDDPDAFIEMEGDEFPDIPFDQ